jgi:hypothetical protein
MLLFISVQTGSGADVQPCARACCPGPCAGIERETESSDVILVEERLPPARGELGLGDRTRRYIGCGHFVVQGKRRPFLMQPRIFTGMTTTRRTPPVRQQATASKNIGRQMLEKVERRLRLPWCSREEGHRAPAVAPLRPMMSIGKPTVSNEIRRAELAALPLRRDGRGCREGRKVDCR